MKLWIVMLVSVSACAGEKAQSPATGERPTTTPPSQPTATPVQPAEPPAPSAVVVSVPLFTKGKVVGCTQWTVGSQFRDAVVEAIKEEQPDRAILSGTCEDEFPGRTVLASCGTYRANRALHSEEFHYDFRMIRDQVHMDCLKGGGTWKQVAEDSREFLRGKLESELAGLKRAAGSTF